MCYSKVVTLVMVDFLTQTCPKCNTLEGTTIALSNCLERLRNEENLGPQNLGGA